MPMWKRLLSGGLLLRSAVRELRGIREQLTRQGDLLERICLAYGLSAPPETRAVDTADTGVDFLDALEAGLVEDYIARTERDTGRKPTDDQVLAFLADGKTGDHLQRQKDQLDRLGRG